MDLLTFLSLRFIQSGVGDGDVVCSTTALIGLIAFSAFGKSTGSGITILACFKLEGGLVGLGTAATAGGGVTDLLMLLSPLGCVFSDGCECDEVWSSAAGARRGLGDGAIGLGDGD